MGLKEKKYNKLVLEYPSAHSPYFILYVEMKDRKNVWEFTGETLDELMQDCLSVFSQEIVDSIYSEVCNAKS